MADRARAATGELTLAEYDAIFAGRKITTGFGDNTEASMALYPNIIGSAYQSLPPSIRSLHDSNRPRAWYGYASVRRGLNPISRLIGWIIGFPPASARTDVTVHFKPDEKGGELWTRNFGEREFSSYQYAGKGRDTHLIVERFGPISVSLAVTLQERRLHLITRRWKLWNLPLPRALMPGGDSFESEVDGNFCFDVTIKVPLIGLIAVYKGTLKPATSDYNAPS